MRYWFRTRWAALDLITRAGLVIYLLICTTLTAISPHLLTFYVWALATAYLYAAWVYHKAQDRLNAPLIDFAMITAPLIAEHDEVVIYRHDGEYKFLAINHDEEEQAP